MDSINSSALVQMNKQLPALSFNSVNNCNNYSQKFVNDIAAFAPNIDILNTGFDIVMNNFASFTDTLSVAQNGLFEMQKQGESIRDLISQAKEEGVTPELLDKIQKEVDSRVAEINNIRNNTNSTGFNPFNSNFSLDIPDVLSLMGSENKEEASNEIANMLGSFDIDISIEGDGFSFGGSAKIEIGFTENGALQINVDAQMDYDLSGLLNNGVSSDEAFDLINNFIGMLGVQQGDLGNAQNFMNALFEQILML